MCCHCLDALVHYLFPLVQDLNCPTLALDHLQPPMKCEARRQRDRVWPAINWVAAAAPGLGDVVREH